MPRNAKIYFHHVKHGANHYGTVCYIRFDDGEELIGISVLAHRDNFSKKIGRAISEGRAWRMKGA